MGARGHDGQDVLERHSGRRNQTSIIQAVRTSARQRDVLCIIKHPTRRSARATRKSPCGGAVRPARARSRDARMPRDRRPAASVPAHVDQRADDVADHVAEEAVRRSSVMTQRPRPGPCPTVHSMRGERADGLARYRAAGSLERGEVVPARSARAPPRASPRGRSAAARARRSARRTATRTAR